MKKILKFFVYCANSAGEFYINFLHRDRRDFLDVWPKVLVTVISHLQVLLLCSLLRLLSHHHNLLLFCFHFSVRINVSVLSVDNFRWRSILLFIFLVTTITESSTYTMVVTVLYCCFLITESSKVFHRNCPIVDSCEIPTEISNSPFSFVIILLSLKQTLWDIVIINHHHRHRAPFLPTPP